MIKKAHHTKLDQWKAEHERGDRGYWGYHGGGGWHNEHDEPILPFKDWENQYQIRDSIRNVKNEKQEENRRKIKPQYFDYRFPEVPEEHIKAKNLTQEEKDRLSQNPGKYVPEGGIINQQVLNQDAIFLPEEAKRAVQEKYRELQKVSNQFYQAYVVANELAKTEIEPIDVNKPLIEIFNSLPKFVESSMKKYIGSIFGLVAYRKEYRWADQATRLLKMIEQGFNIFNVNPRNYESTIHTIDSIIFTMNKILVEYNNRNKALLKAPTIIRDSVKTFLLSRNNRKFLKWLDEEMPAYKKEFMQDLIDEISSAKNNADYIFNLGSLTKIKTYKAVYEKGRDLPHDISGHLSSKVRHEFIDAMANEVSNEIINKFGFIRKMLSDENISPVDKLNELHQYLYKQYKIDIKSILKFIGLLIDKYYDELYAKNAKEGNYDLDDKNIKARDARKESDKNELIANTIANITKDLSPSNYELGIRSIHHAIVEKLKGRLEGVDIQDPRLATAGRKEISELARQKIVQIITQAIPSMSDHYRPHQMAMPFKLDGLYKLVQNGGKLSIDGIIQRFEVAFPDLPRDFALALARYFFKGMENNTSNNILSVVNQLGDMVSNAPVLTMDILLDLLKRSGKYNANVFAQFFVAHFAELKQLIGKIDRDMNRKIAAKTLISIGIRSVGTFEQDTKNLIEFVEFMHNEAGSLSIRDINVIVHNKNFNQFSRVGIVRKVLKAYAQIREKGGVTGIKKTYGAAITKLIQHNYVSKTFYDNVKLIMSIFSSNQIISPADPNFDQIFKAVAQFETDFKIVETAEAFAALAKHVQKKESELFNLDYQLSPNLRFRVLRDMDPRILSIGVETNCCQRMGGVGESAAKDSFLNKLASVLILEYKFGDSWELLTQSYFHYVPEDSGYILDNVEYNAKNVKASGVNLEMAYAKLAAHMQKTFDTKYMLAGEGYSKIDDDKFESFTDMAWLKDPRTFNQHAYAGGYRSSVYTDFSPKSSIDLLKPKFEIDERQEKKAFTYALRKLIMRAALAAAS